MKGRVSLKHWSKEIFVCSCEIFSFVLGRGNEIIALKQHIQQSYLQTIATVWWMENANNESSLLLLFVGCWMSQQHGSVSRGWICSDDWVIHFNLCRELGGSLANQHTELWWVRTCFSTLAPCLQQLQLTGPGQRYNSAWLLYVSSQFWLVAVPGKRLFLRARVIHFNLCRELRGSSANQHTELWWACTCFSTLAPCLQQLQLTGPGQRYNSAWLLYASCFGLSLCLENACSYGHGKLDFWYLDWHSDVIFFPFPKPCDKVCKKWIKACWAHCSAMTGSPNITLVV